MNSAIDRSRIEAVCGGDEALAVELIGMLLEDAAPMVEALEKSVQSNDVAELNELAHSLKGIAGNVGATGLRDASARLQTSSSPDATPSHAALAEEVAEIVAALESVRGTLRTWEARIAGNVGIFAP